MTSCPECGALIICSPSCDTQTHSRAFLSHVYVPKRRPRVLYRNYADILRDACRKRREGEGT